MDSDFKGGCCFCFSARKSSVEEQRDWGKKEEILSDLSTFSVKEQEKRLKKAKEDEDRVSTEAERIISWVKQESARIDDSLVRTVLADDDHHHENNEEKKASK